MNREPVCTIREGADYEYVGNQPEACRGHVYRVLRLAMAVPTYQEQVCVEALTGPDAGNWFCMSTANFARRYRELPQEPDPAPPEVVAGYQAEEWRTGV